MKRAAVFFDRDNTLIANDGYLGDPRGVVLVDGAADAIARVRGMGFTAVTFSNQSGVARGLFPEEAVHAVNARLDELLQEEDRAAVIGRHEFCPFHPDGKIEKYRLDSDLRKPRPGMIFQAAQRLDLDLKRSWVIGDAPRDIEAGQAAGCRTILFSDPKLAASSATIEASPATPEFVVESLKAAVDIIVNEILGPLDVHIPPPAPPPAEVIVDPEPAAVAAPPDNAPPEPSAPTPKEPAAEEFAPPEPLPSRTTEMKTPQIEVAAKSPPAKSTRPSPKITFAERVRSGKFVPAGKKTNAIADAPGDTAAGSQPPKAIERPSKPAPPVKTAVAPRGRRPTFAERVRAGTFVPSGKAAATTAAGDMKMEFEPVAPASVEATVESPQAMTTPLIEPPSESPFPTSAAPVEPVIESPTMEPAPPPEATVESPVATPAIPVEAPAESSAVTPPLSIETAIELSPVTLAPSVEPTIESPAVEQAPSIETTAESQAIIASAPIEAPIESSPIPSALPIETAIESSSVTLAPSVELTIESPPVAQASWIEATAESSSATPAMPIDTPIESSFVTLAPSVEPTIESPPEVLAPSIETSVESPAITPTSPVEATVESPSDAAAPIVETTTQSATDASAASIETPIESPDLVPPPSVEAAIESPATPQASVETKTEIPMKTPTSNITPPPDAAVPTAPAKKMTFAERVKAGTFQAERAASVVAPVSPERPRRVMPMPGDKPQTQVNRVVESLTAVRPTQPITPEEQLEPILQSILEELRQAREGKPESDFSVAKLVAGIVQVLVLPALFFAYVDHRVAADLQSMLMLATFLQTLVIALLIMGRS